MNAQTIFTFAFLFSLIFGQFVLLGNVDRPVSRLLNPSIHNLNPERDLNNSSLSVSRSTHFQGAKHIDLLFSLLDASPEKLRVMKKTIERVQLMSPEQKKEMRGRLKRLKNLPPKLRTKELGKLRKRQDQLNDYWSNLSPEDRKKGMQVFRNLSFAEREKYLKEVIKKPD